MKHCQKMVEMWTLCVQFNSEYSIGSKINHVDQETGKLNTITTTSEAHVVNDIPVVASNQRVIRLSELLV